jgi:glycosyltransferase involved in cell wall biosynthesis
MKILFVVTGLGVGGAENIVVNLADKAKSLGHNVSIVYLTGVANLTPKNKDIPLHSLGMRNSMDFFKAAIGLRKLIKQYEPDVVHSHMVHANILSRLVRLLVRFPRLVCTAHSTNEGGFLRMLTYRITDKLADITTNVSVEAVKVFESKGAVPPGRMVSVPNGVDTTRFIQNIVMRENARSEFGLKELFTLVAVGRLEPEKDYTNLLHAFRLIVDQKNYVHLLIAGGGSQETLLKQAAIELNLTQHISWLGVRSDIEYVLNAADLFVLSSAYEGFGLVVAEAMSCQINVIATDCGGVREVVGQDELLVRPCDSEQLAQRVIAIMEQSETDRASLGKVLRQRVVDHYSLEAMFNNYLKLYH